MADQENTEVWDMDSNKYVLSLSRSSLTHNLSLMLSPLQNTPAENNTTKHKRCVCVCVCVCVC